MNVPEQNGAGAHGLSQAIPIFEKKGFIRKDTRSASRVSSMRPGQGCHRESTHGSNLKWKRDRSRNVGLAYHRCELQ